MKLTLKIFMYKKVVIIKIAEVSAIFFAKKTEVRVLYLFKLKADKMSYDNKVFNINGENIEQLKLAVKLLFSTSGHQKTEAFKYIPGYGLIFYWHTDKSDKSKELNRLMKPMSAESTALYIWAWLQKSPEASAELEKLRESDDVDSSEDEEESIRLSSWDNDIDHDGSNYVGWRLYVDDWGHVNSSPYAIGCIKPVFLWCGK